MNTRVCLSASNRLQTCLPPFLTFDFFINILQQYETGASLMQAVVGTAIYHYNLFKSEMYQGDMFYFDAEGSSKIKVVIIRLIVTEAMYEKEIELWFKLMPKFEKILLEAKDITKFAPNCYFYQRDPVKLLVYEQLAHIGYRSIISYPDLMQMELSLVKIAKWHAVTYKLALEDPSIFEKFQNGCMTMPSTFFERHFLESFVNVLGKFPNLMEFQAYFKEMSGKNFLQEVQDLFLEYRDKKQPDVYYGLCHGDFHFRNMMYKEYKEARFIELQNTYMGPLVHDIICAINMSLGDFNLKYARDELICFYFHIFLNTLRDIKFTGEFPNLAEFRKQIIKNKKFEFFLIYTYLPIWTSIFTDNPVDSHCAMSNNEIFTQMYENEKYIKALEFILPKFLHLGYFDD